MGRYSVTIDVKVYERVVGCEELKTNRGNPHIIRELSIHSVEVPADSGDALLLEVAAACAALMRAKEASEVEKGQ